MKTTLLIATTLALSLTTCDGQPIAPSTQGAATVMGRDAGQDTGGYCVLDIATIDAIPAQVVSAEASDQADAPCVAQASAWVSGGLTVSKGKVQGAALQITSLLSYVPRDPAFNCGWNVGGYADVQNDPTCSIHVVLTMTVTR